MKVIYSDFKAKPIFSSPDVHSEIFDLISENRGELIQSKNEKSVYRIYDGNGEHQFILKIWRYQKLRYWLKDMFKIGNPYTEYRGVRLLNDLGVPCPKIFFFGKIVTSRWECSYYQITENIEPGKDAMEHIKDLIVAKKDQELEYFSNEIMILTQSMLTIPLVDTDYRITNLIVDKRGMPVKIDLELAEPPRWYGNLDKIVGKMVGSLVFSYALAVQPDTYLAQRFADLAFSSLNISNNAKIIAANIVKRALLKQNKVTGINTEIQFEQVAKSI